MSADCRDGEVVTLASSKVFQRWQTSRRRKGGCKADRGLDRPSNKGRKQDSTERMFFAGRCVKDEQSPCCSLERIRGLGGGICNLAPDMPRLAECLELGSSSVFVLFRSTLSQLDRHLTDTSVYPLQGAIYQEVDVVECAMKCRSSLGILIYILGPAPRGLQF